MFEVLMNVSLLCSGFICIEILRLYEQGCSKNKVFFFFRTDSFIFVCRIETCHGNYGKNWGRLSTFSINSVLSIQYLIPLIANNFHANMARTPLCMSLHFLYKFSSLIYYSGHFACDHYAPTRDALSVHARTCPGLPENRKRQLCDKFRDTTPPPQKRKTSIYSFLYSF